MKTLLVSRRQEVLDSLIRQGDLNSATLEESLRKCSETEDIFQYLIDQEIVNEENLTRHCAAIAGIPYVDLSSVDLNPDTLKLLPREIAEEYLTIPLGIQDGKLIVASAYADDISKIDYLRNSFVNYELVIYLASETGVRKGINQYEFEIFADNRNQVPEQEVEQKQKEDNSTFRRFTNRATPAVTLSVQSPIEQIIDSVLKYAILSKCSDIHFESMEEEVVVRVRTDGVLSVLRKIPKSEEDALIAKIKLLSELKVDEKRLPQDGEFSVNVQGGQVDLRVAIAPTIWGEQIVLRILDNSSVELNLAKLGYRGQTLKVVEESLQMSSGMILTSGPTGSGKTTTLYALLRSIAKETNKVITLEDPPEQKMDGINQIHINPSIGLTFAAGLRSVLRCDPETILVGEIRDKETAQLAIQAALTGHLVLSTLHTNSAAGILPRLLDMGIEPFLIASTIRCVLGQRLIRRNISDTEPYRASSAEISAIKKTLHNVLPHINDSSEIKQVVEERLGYSGLPHIDDDDYTLMKAADDADPAFQGRVGIYEAFPVSEDIQNMIIDRSSSSVIQEQAQKEGMITMRQDGYLKALAGLTTPTEIDRVIAEGNV